MKRFIIMMFGMAIIEPVCAEPASVIDLKSIKQLEWIDPYGRDLFIDAVIHKAFVDVDEEGTEAAAATAVVMAKGKVPVFRFLADHPFIFLIRDVSSGSILFLGRVVNPLK